MCVCGVLAFSTTLSASTTVFQLGNQNSSIQNYEGEAAGPYPGTLTLTPPGTQSSLSLFFCLDGNKPTNWGGSYQGDQEPLTVSDSNSALEEAAFLASLMLYDANKYGITLSLTTSGGKASLTQTQTGTMTVGEFVNQVEGPISYAIWQIMGTLGALAQDPNAQPFVAEAQSAWTNVLQYSSNTIMLTFNSSVIVFSPDNSSGSPNPTNPSQRFITAYSDPALIDRVMAAPEPGTVVLFGTGVLLMALGSIRRLARRPS